MQRISDSVATIIRDVQKRGDRALCDMARRFDRVTLKPAQLVVLRQELKDAQKRVAPAVLKSLQECAKNIESFALLEKRELTQSWIKSTGSVRLGQWVRPVDSAGLYIPGGRFPYPSTVMMSAIPARVAGVS